MENRAYGLIYSSSVLYNFSLSMIVILVPLFAYHLSENPFHVGIIISAQGILQFLFRIFGGVLSDRYGERIVLAFSYGAMMLGSFLFVFSDTIWMLILIQLIMGASRSVYWTASQSYASRVNEAKRDKVLGDLTGYVNIGSVLGFLAAGIILDLYGFAIAFGVSGILCTIAFLLALSLESLARLNLNRTMMDILKILPNMLGKKVVYISGMAAGVAAIPVALLGSFYPVYLKDLGYTDSSIGILISLTALGTVAISFLFGYLNARLGQKTFYVLNISGTGLAVLVTPFLQEMWVLGLLMICIGITSGVGIVLYQVIITQFSSVEQRGMYLGVIGLFWSLMMMTVPICFGYLTSLIGLKWSFIVSGTLIVPFSMVTPLFYKILAGTPSFDTLKQ